jgi:non-homologous end joining protein Ku
MLEGSILGKGMLGTTLRYDYEVRDEKNLFKGIPSLRAKKDMVELASHIVDRKAGRFDPGEFKDEYELALRKLVKRKAAGHTIERPAEEPPPANVINLMDALRESMKSKSKSRSKPAPTKKTGQAKSPLAHDIPGIGMISMISIHVPGICRCG